MADWYGVVWCRAQRQDHIPGLAKLQAGEGECGNQLHCIFCRCGAWSEDAAHGQQMLYMNVSSNTWSVDAAHSQRKQHPLSATDSCVFMWPHSHQRSSCKATGAPCHIHATWCLCCASGLCPLVQPRVSALLRNKAELLAWLV